MATPIAACSAKPVASARSGVGERLDLVAGQGEHAVDRAVQLERHAEDRPVAADLLARRREVLAVGEDVLDLDRVADQRDPADDAVAAGPDRVVALPVVELRAPAGRRRDPIRVALEDVRHAVVGAAEARRRADGRIEHDLEVERRAAHDRQDLVRRRLPVDRRDLGVVQALAGERRRDPRLEDRGIDGLGQVVGGAHLEAADGAVQLVDAGDHDDRQVPQGRIVGDRRERLVAVHDRHDDVEQDHVDRRLLGIAQPIERLLTVLRIDGLVPDPPQQPAEQLAVEGGVVDDEDPPGRVMPSPAGGVMQVLRRECRGWSRPRDRGLELLGSDRLAHVVVHAGREARLPVTGHRVRRQADDPDLAGRASVGESGGWPRGRPSRASGRPSGSTS